jgi:hypothetical protein
MYLRLAERVTLPVPDLPTWLIRGPSVSKRADHEGDTGKERESCFCSCLRGIKGGR